MLPWKRSDGPTLPAQGDHYRSMKLKYKDLWYPDKSITGYAEVKNLSFSSSDGAIPLFLINKEVSVVINKK
jgi:hypothetical protein